MSIIMKSLDMFLDEVGKKLPDVRDYLNKTATDEEIGLLANKVRVQIPKDLKELYSSYNGETEESDIGILFGLRFLPIEDVIREYENLSELEYEMEVMGTNAIAEGPVNEHIWIPIAHDGDSCFIAVDLTPNKSGKKGQVITIDHEYENTYLLAESITKLFDKMTKWLKEGRNVIAKDNSDHTFNMLDELCTYLENTSEGTVALPEGFWQEYGERKMKKPVTEIGTNVLALEKTMFIRENKIDCAPFKYMSSLKELVFIDCEISGIEILASLPELTKLSFARCTFIDGDLSVLKTSPKLKEINVNYMDADGLVELSSLSTLKVLGLIQTTGLTEGFLSKFSKLQELRIEKIYDGWTVEELGSLKNLKKLELKVKDLSNLDFLEVLLKLKEFECHYKALDEKGLANLVKLTKLTSFEYPVKDISIYKGCDNLTNVGFAPDVKGDFSIFEGGKVSSFMVCGKTTDLKMKSIAKNMNKYVKIWSYGNVAI
jgi:Protein involved in beta-1,3-glucan synthesis